MAAQLTLSIGRSARLLALCSARATSSLPTPLSPRTNTQPVALATRLIIDFSFCIGGLSPISSSKPALLATSR